MHHKRIVNTGKVRGRDEGWNNLQDDRKEGGGTKGSEKVRTKNLHKIKEISWKGNNSVLWL